MDSLFKQTPSVTFIPCVKWVRRGVAKPNPEKVELTKEELAQIIAQGKSRLRDANETDAAAGSSLNAADEYNLEHYDEEDGVDMGIDGIATMSDGEGDESDGSDSDSEKEDDLIKPDDNLLVVGKVEDNCSVLEIYVFNEAEDSFYVHHDFMLPSIPLCLEWLNYEPGHSDRANLCAVGSMSPVIEVWDLDVVNCLEAAFTLGRQSSRRRRITGVGHKDAVLDLAWNINYHHVLASGSVDKTVLLWDLDEGRPHTALTAFADKVQCLRWHRSDPQALLAGSCDRTAKLFDCRAADTCKSWQLEGEAERLLWDPFHADTFFCGSSTGTLQCFDCRKGLLWSSKVHEKEVTGLCVSERCRGLMVSAGSDGLLKVWDHRHNNLPRLVHSQELTLGTIHCLEQCPDSVFAFAAGGDNKTRCLSVLDLTTFDAVKREFGSRDLEPAADPEQEEGTDVMETQSSI